MRGRGARWRAVLVGLAVVMLVGATGTARAAQVVEPHADPFYVPDPGFGASAPGTVLRTRAVTVTGLGIPLPYDATQVLVRSTDAHGRAMAIVSTVIVPRTGYANGGRPLLSYQPAIDSLGDQCQPSYTLRAGVEKEIPAFLPGLMKGWAVVVTDYQGPRNAYGAGRLEGLATLDGIRAALSLPGTRMSGRATPVGLWGYSGGALATGWAAQLAPSYAPELHLVGVAAGGTPSDLGAAGRAIDGGPAAGLFLAAAVGVSREYPEILDLMNDAGRQMADRVGDMCVYQEAGGFPFAHLADYTTVPDPLSDPVVQGVLTENRMGQLAPQAPVFLFHSRWDELIPYATAQTLRADWCARGAAVLFSTDYLSEHISLAISGAPAALVYLNARFAGQPAPSNCVR